MAGNAERLREAYEAFSNGDLEGATESRTDDFTWQGPNPEELPGAGEHKGKDAALEVLQQTLGAWDEFKLSPDESLEQGDTVV